MSAKRWILTDVATGTYESEFTVKPEDVGGPARGYSVTKKTLRGGLSDGVDVVSVDNGLLSFAVLPTRGMNLWKAWLGKLEIGWQSPIRGPVHPQFVPLGEPSGLGWLDGFDELVARCGLESNGAPEFDKSGKLQFPLHGRISNRPAHYVDVAVSGETGEITVTGVVEEARFHFSKLRMTTIIKTKVGEPTVRIQDVVENVSSLESGMQMLYHINLGLPLLDTGSKFVAPAKILVPRTEWAARHVKHWDTFGPEQRGFEEQVYFLELAAAGDGGTQVLLKNGASEQGVSLRFNKRRLPCFSLWKDTAAAADGYVTGLEPATNFPNPRSYEAEQGRVVKLPPGGRLTIDLEMEVHDNATSIARSERQIADIQSGQELRIFDKPQKGWCA